ncbi:MAG TPA: ATP-binding protein [Acetobacteraceae bacterium]|nr:ATP-binding protein [Acetobacteraceae bacterium]
MLGRAVVWQTATLIAGVPVAALLVLAATGAATVLPALLAALAVVVAAFALAAAWTAEQDALAETLRTAANNGAGYGPAPAIRFLPPARIVAVKAERVTHLLADRNELIGRLLRSEESVVEHLPDPLIVLGADRAVKRANLAARQLLGADLSAVLRRPALRAAIDLALLPEPEPKPQAVDLSIPGPVPRDVHASVIGLDPPLGDGGRAILILSDRTRERAVERMRADFVANVSHELRTPLTSLMGFIETLRGPAADDPPAQARFLAIMAEQALRMNRLIDDLLSLSRIELSEHQVPQERVDVADLISRLLAAFEPGMRERQVTLEWSPPADLPAVTGDEDQLAQVIQNLVDNALKYGKQGGRIRVGIAAVQPGGRWPNKPGLMFWIQDDGPGIPRVHLPRLTERFYRVDKSRSRGINGTGLGLAIVKHIVNRHRGQFLIESDEGRGATFTVWLPAG